MGDALVPEDYHRGGTLSQLEQSIRPTGFQLSQRPTCLHFLCYIVWLGCSGMHSILLYSRHTVEFTNLQAFTITTSYTHRVET